MSPQHTPRSRRAVHASREPRRMRSRNAILALLLLTLACGGCFNSVQNTVVSPGGNVVTGGNVGSSGQQASAAAQVPQGTAAAVTPKAKAGEHRRRPAKKPKVECVPQPR